MQAWMCSVIAYQDLSKTLWKLDYAWHAKLICWVQRVLMNKAVGKYSLSWLCLKSLTTQNTFQGLKCLQGGKKKNDCVFLCIHMCAHTHMWVCTCESVRFAASIDNSLNLVCSLSCFMYLCCKTNQVSDPCCQILFFLRCNDSLGCSLFAIHKDEVARGGNGPESVLTPVAVAHAWPYINTSSHAIPADLFITSRSQLSALPDTGFDDSSQRGVPIGRRRRNGLGWPEGHQQETQWKEHAVYLFGWGTIWSMNYHLPSPDLPVPWSVSWPLHLATPELSLCIRYGCR